MSPEKGSVSLCIDNIALLYYLWFVIFPLSADSYRGQFGGRLVYDIGHDLVLGELLLHIHTSVGFAKMARGDKTCAAEAEK